MNANYSSASFLNRDHIILVTVDQTRIVVTTVLGTRITFMASPMALAEFGDDLANNVESNFVSITSAIVSTHS
jgi:hypothetical protein